MIALNGMSEAEGERACRACRNEQKRAKRAITRGDKSK